MAQLLLLNKPKKLVEIKSLINIIYKNTSVIVKTLALLFFVLILQ